MTATTDNARRVKQVEQLDVGARALDFDADRKRGEFARSGELADLYAASIAVVRAARATVRWCRARRAVDVDVTPGSIPTTAIVEHLKTFAASERAAIARRIAGAARRRSA